MPSDDLNEERAVKIAVPSEKKNDDPKSSKQKKQVTPEEMSEEDLALKEGLELSVLRLSESDIGLYKQALDYLCTEIRSSTSSMTSVPKPFKFLLPHYSKLKETYFSWPDDHSMKTNFADVLSVLAMTMSTTGVRESLKFRLKGTKSETTSWGHEYIRSLAGEISNEFTARMAEDNNAYMDDLMDLVDEILPFQMQHNAEAEAIDLLIEVQQLNKLLESPSIDAHNFERVCLYLLRCANFMPDPDDLNMLFIVSFDLYRRYGSYCDALRVALRQDDLSRINQLFSYHSGASELMKRQMAFILARHRSIYTSMDDTLNQIIGNCRTSYYYMLTARSLDVLEPKTPEDIFKSHLAEGSYHHRSSRNNPNATSFDSARNNLASTFVNAFVNAGYGNDKLVTIEEGNQWIYKNRDHAMVSAVASIGLIFLWDVDEGLNQIDRYLHTKEEYITTGACLAVGIVNCGVRHESDPALALLGEFLYHPSHSVKCGCILGLGLAYSGTRRHELLDRLLPVACSPDSISMIEASFAAISLGMIYVGTCNVDIGSALIQRLMEASDEELNFPMVRMYCLGLGLLYLGKCERAEAVIEAVKTIEHPIGKYAAIIIESCAFAGTGNVLKIQKMLLVCAEHLSEHTEHQAVAVLAIAVITVGEDIGTEMCLRTFDHLLQYGSLPVKRAVPLAIALLFSSNPDYSVVDQLSRLSHDVDHEVSQGAIFAIGIVAAGTNNSRIAGILRQLSDFYAKDANHLFIVKIAQGLNCVGKGLISLNLFHSDRFLLSGTGIGGLLVVLHACLDFKGTIFDKFHYLLYFLSPAMNTRYLVTVGHNLTSQPTTVRVGLAVETVGQAGRPKTITGFQTHTTPVLMSLKERAELAGSEFVSLTSIIEGVVVLDDKDSDEEDSI